MVDDHDMILNGYKSVLIAHFREEESSLIIDTAHDSEEALKYIENSLNQRSEYDIVYLDINIPPSADNRIKSGEDIGKEIREVSPSTSLIVLTMYSENLRLLNILKNLNPEAFLIKSDIKPPEFIKAFLNVLKGEVHYSQSILGLIRKQMTTDIILSANDRSILYHISEGVRTKDLVREVPLSLAAIEKRKKVMREIFEVEKDGDIALINKAKKLGFL